MKLAQLPEYIQIGAFITFNEDKPIHHALDFFDELCNEIGLSNSAAVTIFMKAAVREQRIPFELRTETEDEIRARSLAAFHKLRAIAQENGVAGMSLEEINEEIRLARRGE